MKDQPTNGKDPCTHQKDQKGTSQAARQTLFDQYRQDADHYHDWATETVNFQFIYLNRFLDWLDYDAHPGGLSELNPASIRSFIFDYADGHGPGSCKWMQFALRSFLRFCHRQGLLSCDWSAVVPAMRAFKLATVPRVIDADQIRCLLESIDRSSAAGKRDYAMILLLSTYGVRGVQLRHLQCSDIHWREDRLCFPAAKGGHPLTFPLVDEAGAGLLDYLREGRPEVSVPQVFLTLRTPFTALRHSGSLSGIIAKRLREAGIVLPEESPRGSHLFRHSLASRLLEKGHGLKHIADLLGHRYLDSTLIYTKIDLGALHSMAAPWPKKEVTNS